MICIVTESKMNDQKPNDAVLDAFDNGNEYLLEFDLHGLTREEIHISRHGEALFLTGVRTAQSHGENFPGVERPNGAFVQRLVLPPDSCLNEIRATFQDGTLHVHVPKKPAQDGNEKSQTGFLEEPGYEPETP